MLIVIWDAANHDQVTKRFPKKAHLDSSTAFPSQMLASISKVLKAYWKNWLLLFRKEEKSRPPMEQVEDNPFLKVKAALDVEYRRISFANCRVLELHSYSAVRNDVLQRYINRNQPTRVIFVLAIVPM